MTLEEEQEANDALRSQFKGGRVLMTPAVRELEPHMRGRMLHRLTLYDRFHDESDHSEGVFVFAAYSFYWKIRMEADVRTLTIYLEGDLLIEARD